MSITNGLWFVSETMTPKERTFWRRVAQDEAFARKVIDQLIVGRPDDIPQECGLRAIEECDWVREYRKALKVE